MFRVCAWCERFLGFTPPFSNPDVTHGVCGTCTERLHRDEIGRRGRSLIVVRDSRRDLRDYLEGQYAGVPDVMIRMDERARERRGGAPYAGLERRRVIRRRELFQSQLAAWQTLGVFVVHGVR